jgi:lambda family phage portal protein
VSGDTAHDAASLTDAKIAAWVPNPGSADADLLQELPVLVPRARDLARNSGLASGYIQTVKDNIVGSQLRLSTNPDYRILGRDREWAREWGATVEAEFRTWADTVECDAAKTMNLLGLTNVMLAGAFMNGEALALPLWVERSGERWSSKLQTVEADRLSVPTGRMNDASIRDGIEIDIYGAPAAYHIQRTHPGDQYGGLFSTSAIQQWDRIPAFTPWGRRRVVHLHDKERTGQSRGKPVFTSVLREFKVSSEYVGHELQTAAVGAMIAAFLESDLDPVSVSELFGNDPDGKYWKDVSDKFNRKKLDGGLIMTLPVGTKLNGFSPNRPNTAFDGFMSSVMRHISAGLNIPYELLLKDFSKTNYSSARAALLEAWRYFLSRRRWLCDLWLRPVYELWLEEAINLGRVEAPDYYENRYAYNRCRWIFSGRGWVDPVKEANAAVVRVQNSFSTLEEECAEQGRDWEEVLEQRAIEKAKLKELGLSTQAVFGEFETTAGADGQQENQNA